jgi:hypothetical protein
VNRFKVYAMGLALPGLILAAPVQAGATRSAQSIPAGTGQGGQCEVKVARTGQAGLFDVAREVLDAGKCICWVKMGPRGAPGSPLEARLSALEQSKSCADAPLVARAAPPAAGSGLGGSAIWLGVAAAGLAGLILVATKKDSPGS